MGIKRLESIDIYWNILMGEKVKKLIIILGLVRKQLKKQPLDLEKSMAVPMYSMLEINWKVY